MTDHVAVVQMLQESMDLAERVWEETRKVLSLGEPPLTKVAPDTAPLIAPHETTDPDSLATVQYAGYLAFAAFTIRQLVNRDREGKALTADEQSGAEQVAAGLDNLAANCRA